MGAFTAAVVAAGILAAAFWVYLAFGPLPALGVLGLYVGGYVLVALAGRGQRRRRRRGYRYGGDGLGDGNGGDGGGDGGGGDGGGGDGGD